jgi:hypothetical protein
VVEHLGVEMFYHGRARICGTPSLSVMRVTMAHLCGGGRLEREGSTKESKYHAKRAKDVHQRV